VVNGSRGFSGAGVGVWNEINVTILQVLRDFIEGRVVRGGIEVPTNDAGVSNG